MDFLFDVLNTSIDYLLRKRNTSFDFIDGKKTKAIFAKRGIKTMKLFLRMKYSFQLNLSFMKEWISKSFVEFLVHFISSILMFFISISFNREKYFHEKFKLNSLCMYEKCLILFLYFLNFQAQHFSMCRMLPTYVTYK